MKYFNLLSYLDPIISLWRLFPVSSYRKAAPVDTSAPSLLQSPVRSIYPAKSYGRSPTHRPPFDSRQPRYNSRRDPRFSGWRFDAWLIWSVGATYSMSNLGTCRSLADWVLTYYWGIIQSFCTRLTIFRYRIWRAGDIHDLLWKRARWAYPKLERMPSAKWFLI